MRFAFSVLTAVIALLTSACAKEAGESAAATSAIEGESATAVFAGGCFWCVEADFEKLEGVAAATSGYTGGIVVDPDYEQVTYGDTGHFEAVKVDYDPEIVSYRELVRYYFRTVDPTDPDGQFCDKGQSYRTAIFPATAEERLIAIEERDIAETALGREVVTEILDLGPFYPAEGYHQDYYKKNALKYSLYRTGCGRDGRLRALWGDSVGAK